MPGQLMFFKKKRTELTPSGVFHYEGSASRDLKAFSGSGYRYLEIDLLNLASKLQVFIRSTALVSTYPKALAGYRTDGYISSVAGNVSSSGNCGLTFATGDTMMVAIRMYGTAQGDICIGKNGVWYSGGEDGRVIYSYYDSAWSGDAFVRLFNISSMDSYNVVCNPSVWKYGNLKPAGAVAYPY